MQVATKPSLFRYGLPGTHLLQREIFLGARASVALARERLALRRSGASEQLDALAREKLIFRLLLRPSRRWQRGGHGDGRQRSDCQPSQRDALAAGQFAQTRGRVVGRGRLSRTVHPRLEAKCRRAHSHEKANGDGEACEGVHDGSGWQEAGVRGARRQNFRHSLAALLHCPTSDEKFLHHDRD